MPMSTLAWILLSCVAGGILSVVLAGVLTLGATAAQVPLLVSFAVGALLGAVFLEILPHAVEAAAGFRTVTTTVLAGILLFFVLEKLVFWRHCHSTDCEAHDPPGPHHDHGRSGTLILVGDTFHNFVDGILIAAAFLADVQIGIVTALAIVAHEIPQELSDFLILLHSGFSRGRAFLYNAISGVAMVAGGVLGYFALQPLISWVSTLIALAAASMLYVAVADLIPGLHRRPELRSTFQQTTLIGLGVGCIWTVGHLVRHAAGG
jgi:zinc and cadmium transporter